MEYIGNTLAIETSWLVESGVVSESNYKQLSARGNISVLRRGCLNTPAMVDFESMPERFKRKIEAIVGNPYDAVKVNQVQERIRDNAEVREFFEGYRLADGRFLPAETRREYYANAIVLDAVHDIVVSKRTKRAALGAKPTRAWAQLADAVMEIDRTRYPHSLPANGRRLEDKYKRYKQEGAVSLIHKNFLNKNAASVDDDTKESVLAVLISDPRNLDNAPILLEQSLRLLLELSCADCIANCEG